MAPNWSAIVLSRVDADIPRAGSCDRQAGGTRLDGIALPRRAASRAVSTRDAPAGGLLSRGRYCRDPGDIRCNLALGKLLYRRGQYRGAEEHFRAAIERATRHNPNPADGECHYNLGLALGGSGQVRRRGGRLPEIDVAHFLPGLRLFPIGDELPARRGDWAAAEELLRRALDRNARHHQAAHLLMVCARRTGQTEDALELADGELKRDPFNFGVLFEEAFSLGGDWSDCDRRMRDSSHNYLELAIDYAAAGRYERAIAVLRSTISSALPSNRTHRSCTITWPISSGAMGDAAAAIHYSKLGAKLHRQGFFPNRREDLAVLQVGRGAIAGRLSRLVRHRQFALQQAPLRRSDSRLGGGPRSGRRLPAAAPQLGSRVFQSARRRLRGLEVAGRSVPAQSGRCPRALRAGSARQAIESRRRRATRSTCNASELRQPPRRPDDRANHAAQPIRPT